MAQKFIASGRPPIVWSDVDTAFQSINQNFTELYLSIGGSGADLTNLSSSLIPDLDITRDLGSPSKRWRDLYLSGNSIYLGNGNITADETGAVNLPAGSRVGGDLIKDPQESSFKTINITGQSSVVADDFEGVLTLVGSGINITTNAGTDTITFSNAGVTTLVAGTGMAVSTPSGAVTISNAGVTGVSTGTGISTSAPNGNIVLTNTGVTSVTAGNGIQVTPAGTGNIVITNQNPFPQNIFRTVAVTGQSSPQTSLVPITPVDTITLASSGGLSISTNAGTNTISFSLSSLIDIKGSIFGDDSSVLVDAVNNYIYGNVSATTLRTADTKIALGSSAASTNQTTGAIAIGTQAGEFNQSMAISIGIGAGQGSQGFMATAVGHGAAQVSQGTYAVAIGTNSGQVSQGAYAVAIGSNAGTINQPANSILLNASGSALNAAGSGLFVSPIREMLGPQILFYDPATKEISYGDNNSGDMVGSVFSENSTLLVDGLNGQIVGPINSFDGGNSISMTVSGVIIGGTAGAQIIGAAGAPVYIGGGSSGSTTGNIYIGNGTNRTLFVSNIISTDDSSTLIFDPPVTFNTNVSVGGDLTVDGIINGYISLQTLKSIVAASASFNDFQNNIAAL